ncbi:MAG: response regulator transcription factor [Anaerolineae bacterium]|nr:response regulator transcription factor [Anaerolineae bacterium]
MEKETILIVDDEKNIRNLLKMYLIQAGYAVSEAHDGPATLAYLECEPDPQLIILDIMLPGMDGFQVCKSIKTRADSDIPILMLTARDDDVDKIVGLEIGADDYVTKPFNPREVVARVKAILRRSQAHPDLQDDVIKVGDLVIDQNRRTVWLNSVPITLRRKEFDLLVVLAQQKEFVHSRDQLLDDVWGYDYYGQTRTVDVHIASLRSKIKESSITIETVTGIGYRLSTSHA